MAQSRKRSKTVTLANGNRVTITTGSNRSGWYRTVTVLRGDGTSDSRTDRRGAGLLGSGGFLGTGLGGGAFGDDIPAWALGSGRPATGASQGIRQSLLDRHLKKMATATEAAKRLGAEKTLSLTKAMIRKNEATRILSLTDEEAEPQVAAAIRKRKRDDPAGYRAVIASLPQEDREKILLIEKKYGV